MIKVITMTSNEQPTDNLIKITTIGDKSYYASSVDWQSVLDKDEELKVMSAKVFDKQALNNNVDDTVDLVYDLFYNIDNKLLSKIMLVAYNDDRRIDTEEKLIDKMIEDVYFIDRLITNAEKGLTKEEKKTIAKDTENYMTQLLEEATL